MTLLFSTLAARLTRRPLWQKWLGAALMLLALFPLRRVLLPPDPDAGKLRLTVLDVGQGDCLLLQTPQGHTILIDGGGANDEQQASQSDVGEQVVLPFLRSQGIGHLDVLVITHPHGDHVGGLAAVLRQESIGVVLDGTCLPYPSPAYRQVRALISTRHIPYLRAVRGLTMQLDPHVRADVLNPPAQGDFYGTTLDNTVVNNDSAVLRISYGRTHFLLDGDAQSEAEQSMLAAGFDLSADVLKVGHHGAGNASTDAWLARVRPRFAAISCGLHNHFGHPHPATLARLAAHHVQVFRTDHNGAIVFVSDGKTVTARPFIRETADLGTRRASLEKSRSSEGGRQ